MISFQDIRLINFLLDHPEFSVNIISQYYPFTREELIKYSEKLDWFWVSINEAIVWNEKLFKEFSDLISLSALSNNKTFPWTEKFIDEHYVDLFYYLDINGIGKTTFSQNTSLPWSEQLIEKYEEHWNWSELSSNEGIPFTIELIKKYKDSWDKEWFEYNKRIISDPVLKLHIGITDSYHIHVCEYCEKNKDYVLKQKKLLYKCLLSCPKFTWDLSLLNQLKDALDNEKESKNILNYLSNNKSFPWDLTVLELFQQEWNYISLQMNESVGHYFTERIIISSVIETLMIKLPKFDLKNIKYSV
jgi:hypothetical protein